MRLFAYRADAHEAGGWFALSGGSVNLGPGIRVGRLYDDDTVEVGEGRRVARARLRPAPAVPAPGKIVCVGLNYRDHVAEQHIDTPSRPVLFAKFGNAVIGDGEPIVSPEGTHALDLEVELGVIIGRRARRVSRADALGHVAGYVVVNDVTARDWQGNKAALAPGEKGDGQWLRAKGSDTFLPMGPVLAMADERLRSLPASPSILAHPVIRPGGR